MDNIIAIRREDKNQWERRTPLIPEHVRELKEKYGIKTIVQPSKIRIFTDEEYRRAGAEINENMSRAGVLLAIKEIPVHLFEKDKAYVFFSHTIKGQPYNMTMLKKMVDRECTLIDYERIIDEKNRRLIFFGRFAGIAGMIETLYAYGQKMKLRGYDTPFERIKQPYQYPSFEEAKREITEIGREIRRNGLPAELTPLVVGFTGYGNVSGGAQEVFDLLPHQVIPAEKLKEKYRDIASDNFNLYKVVFYERDMVRAAEGAFDLQDYYNHPEKYEGIFENYIPHLSILVNCIYWTEKYPRLVTKKYLKDHTRGQSELNLTVIGDISCDIDGAIEITPKATRPDNPTVTYFPESDKYEDGTLGKGITVMAVDNLPCEFPRDSSTNFSNLLKGFIKGIAVADFRNRFDKLDLPEPIKKALVLHRGHFTPGYRYMEEFLK